ncbi:RecQ family ATP-dependent DNA helicase [Paucibacter sp. R3-3]|uniref:ATP-dependent DNA helicase RecQ n=1 Tax=Roseateles agri TaxID=3098619 RepID=A0ABU5DPJ3_9BURK|nr:RecQ family ATP-dependent DNA helicase [Paucibacter sp. R3-3]MDY0747570.1 RecQ family ATP-dependent DNA helicase [Paucibacter sp. R3-3]
MQVLSSRSKVRPTSRQTVSARLRQRVTRQLRRLFGLQRLRPGQQETIDRVLRGLNTLAVMPTGAGKSLCYQLPATLLPGLTVVISPLIALMQDQYDRLQQLGVATVQLNSALDAETQRESLLALDLRQVRVLFTTPERFADPAFQAMLKQQQLALLVVDEAHCISRWGHDFRPAFAEIGTALLELDSPPVLALTATAADEVIEDIATQLRIPAAGVLAASSYRPNLRFGVETMADEAAKRRRTVEIVAEEQGAVIVYATTVKAAEAVHSALLEAGTDADLYHGKLSAPRRRASQMAFMNGETRVIVATNAFGLGIDKPDIRLVLHYQLPPGLDAYYQEAGRAGRDGLPARCELLFLAGDRAVQQFFLNGRYPTADDGRALVGLLASGNAADASGWTLARLKERLQRPAAKLRVLLNLMRGERLIDIDREGRISVGAVTAGMVQLDAMLAGYVERSEQDRARLEQMVAYAQTGACRWRALLEGFQEPLPFADGRCLQCDNCRRMARHEVELERQTEQILPKLDGDAASSQRESFSPGDYVRVRRYGAGTVVDASNEAVTVAFGEASERRSFRPDFVKRARVPRRTAGAEIAASA